MSIIPCMEGTLTLRRYLKLNHISIYDTGLIVRKVCVSLVQLKQSDIYPILDDDSIYLLYESMVSTVMDTCACYNCVTFVCIYVMAILCFQDLNFDFRRVSDFASFLKYKTRSSLE